MLERKTIDSAIKIQEAYNKIFQERNQNGTISFPALEAILACFARIRHAQTALEAAKTPLLMMVLPMLERVKFQL